MTNANKSRGVIRFRDRKRQILSFENLRWGNITPTDIDGFIEYHNRLTILIEVKYGNAVPSYGQKLAITRTVDDIEKSGKKCIAFFCWHNVDDPYQDIIAAKTQVRYAYTGGKWHVGNCTLQKAIDEVIYGANKNVSYP